jgi:hypothetical protein
MFTHLAKSSMLWFPVQRLSDLMSLYTSPLICRSNSEAVRPAMGYPWQEGLYSLLNPFGEGPVSRTPTLHGGWLGSGTDEGSGKLLYARGRRTQPSNPGFPNGTSCFGDP